METCEHGARYRLLSIRPSQRLLAHDRGTLPHLVILLHVLRLHFLEFVQSYGVWVYLMKLDESSLNMVPNEREVCIRLLFSHFILNSTATLRYSNEESKLSLCSEGRQIQKIFQHLRSQIALAHFLP
jgi:hypothetical protein